MRKIGEIIPSLSRGGGAGGRGGVMRNLLSNVQASEGCTERGEPPYSTLGKNKNIMRRERARKGARWLGDGKLFSMGALDRLGER